MDAVYRSLGTIIISLSTAKGIQNSFVKLEIVSTDDPAFFSLDGLDHRSLIADTVGSIPGNKSSYT